MTTQDAVTPSFAISSALRHPDQLGPEVYEGIVGEEIYWTIDIPSKICLRIYIPSKMCPWITLFSDQPSYMSHGHRRQMVQKYNKRTLKKKNKNKKNKKNKTEKMRTSKNSCIILNIYHESNASGAVWSESTLVAQACLCENLWSLR